MKKLFVTTLLLALATMSFAYDFTVDGIYYNILSAVDKTVEVTNNGDNSYSASEITIPASVTNGENTYSVVQIGKDAFSGCSNITSVSLPNTITVIGESAFWFCSSLASINIPNSLTSIEKQVFSYCKSLQSVELPNTITTIGESAFLECEKLASINIPNSVTSIGSGTFKFCTSLQSLVLPNTITAIGESAFYDCKLLTSVNIPNLVTSIGSGTFKFCTSLQSLVLPSTITAIGNDAFYDCESLVSINIPNSVTSIGSGAFSSCKSLQSVALPNTITTLSSDVLNSCTSLSSITIPESVTSIESRAFANCTGLTSIVIPKGVTSISGTPIGGCTNLATITVDSENTTYDSRGNCNAIIETSSNTLVVGCKNTTFPDDVTVIGDDAFSGCTGLTSITIGNNITTIGNNAFSGSSNLVSVEILKPVTTIGSCAFMYCSALKTIDIPTSVTSIGYSCFFDCTSLESFVWPSSVTNIAYSMFEFCSSLKSVEISEGVTSIGNTAFRETALTEVTFPSTLTSIGDCAFEDCNSMVTITFSKNENKVTLESGAFRFCRALTTIYAGSTTPPTVCYGSSGTLGISDCSKVTLYVPYGSKSAYGNVVEPGGAEDGWCGITNIVEDNYERAVLYDENAYTATNQDGVVCNNIVYYRIFKNTNFQALFLPCSLAYDDYSENFDLYAIDNFTQYDTDGDGTLDATYLYVVKAKLGDVTHPNYPYLIKAKNADSKYHQVIVAKNKTLYSGATTGENNILTTQTATRTYTFTGNYANDFDMYTNGYWGLAGGVLHQAASADVKLSSFRWYLDIKDRSYTPFGSNASDPAAKVINIMEIGDDGEASFVGTLSTDDATPVNYISVDGKVSNQPFHGLNIIRMSDGTTRKQIMK